MTTASTTATGRQTYPGISPTTWEHPTDRAALTALRAVPGFDIVLKRLFAVIGEKSLRMYHDANAIKVSSLQFGRLHERFLECCEILDAQQVPDLYVAQFPLLNAMTIGLDNPFIVVNTSTAEILDDDELHFVLGHELGHALSGHALYKTMLSLLMRLTFSGIPLTRLVFFAVILALREWDRKSELSADRAGLLCVQNPETAYKTFMKMAGGTRTDDMNLEAFLEQAAQFEQSDTVGDSLVKLMNNRFRSHPFSVTRAAEIMRWIDTDEYRKVLAGEYRDRDNDDPDFRQDVKTAVSAYRERMARSDDVIAQTVSDWTEKATDAAKDMRDRMRKPNASEDLEDYAWEPFDVDFFEEDEPET